MSTLAPVKEPLPPHKHHEEESLTLQVSNSSLNTLNPMPPLQDIGLFTTLIDSQSQDVPASHVGGDSTRWLENLTLKVTESLPAQPQDFRCQLLLPNLGEVELQAQYQASTWQIQLAFRRQRSAQAVRQEQDQLTEHFSRALQAPVVLSINSLEGEQQNA
ncbi:type III secretion system HrpP C-terminal domain-containing protein [Vibrio porteresiae]|uniref:Type III secretion system HrpP C-terminal domain-containing protein n=1 Tax=Vibrio porteresiae DSM 19223 TaxID=1123496 RepID=A0ABZ0QAP2_9VIBR|nr:type III secretion system HrpP C-terminal domain-containing protein [Vibrio porteresiae]WPC73489.1 type III secretion system HrpP C-terminal domain-containing protein [Vibrio porteresiae DSM 19223]